MGYGNIFPAPLARSVAAVAVGVFLAALLSTHVLAQPGTAGGVVGNRDKSVSGSEETEPPARPSKEAPSRRRTESESSTAEGSERQPRDAHSPSGCAKLPGVWSWFFNGNVTFHANGTAVQPQSGWSAKWSCTGDHVVVFWSQGVTDRLTLSREGTHLEGTNGVVAVSGDRL